MEEFVDLPKSSAKAIFLLRIATHSFGVGVLYNFIALIGSFHCHFPGWLAERYTIISNQSEDGGRNGQLLRFQRLKSCSTVFLSHLCVTPVFQ